jgi:hypothetical protein
MSVEFHISWRTPGGFSRNIANRVATSDPCDADASRSVPSDALEHPHGADRGRGQ